MVTNGTGRQFDTVTHDVILPRLDIKRVHGFKGFKTALRHRERVVAEFDLAVVVFLVHREINDPAEFEHAVFTKAQFIANLVARLAGKFGCCQFLVTGKEDRIAIGNAGNFLDLCDAFGIKIFGNRAFGFAVFIVNDVTKTSRPFFAGPGIELVKEAARAASGPRCRNGANHRTLFDVRGKDAEIRTAEGFGHVRQDDRVAKVGFVRAVFRHRFIKRNARERKRRYVTTTAEFDEDVMKNRLDRIKHVVLGGKGHLEVELIKLARGAVGTGVFIAEARCDLEITVKARNHQKLLELLGGLRQGIKFARMHARRYEEVTRTFGRACRQDRGLDFQKSLCGHFLTHRRDHARAQNDVRMNTFATQIKVTVTQADFLAIFGIAKYRHRQHVGRRLDFDVRCINLDLAGRQVRVDGFGGTFDDLAVHRDHTFGARLFKNREKRA